MKRLNFVAIGVTFLVFLFMACAPKVQAPITAPISEKSSALAKTGWEAEWEKTLRAAQKEGKVVVYAVTPGPALREAAPGFEDKFGFTLEVITGSPSELRGRIGAERAAGLYLQDLFMTGMSSHFFVSRPQNWALPMDAEFILPEVKDQKNWFGGKHPFQWGEKKVFTFLLYPTMNMAYNSDLVKEGEITSYYDFLDPRWSGKVVINDPTVTGTAWNGFNVFVKNGVLDLDYFRKLAKQGLVIRDATRQIDVVARGKYSLIMWPDSRAMQRYQQAGAPIMQLEPKEGSYLSVDGSGTIVLDKRPHPSATRIFLNWLFSREGQIHIQKEMRYHSARVDIGTEGVDPLNMRNEGMKYYEHASLDLEWMEKEVDKYQSWVNEIFGAK